MTKIEHAEWLEDSISELLKMHIINYICIAGILKEFSSLIEELNVKGDYELYLQQEKVKL